MTRKVNYSKIFIVTSLAIYLTLNVITKLYDRYIDAHVEHCDLNENGFLEENELTANCKSWMDMASRDTARNFAPFTLVPISILIGASVVFIGKLVNMPRQFKKFS